jgi:ABC-type branched-subunit amino acid transport system substrate-binding protein
MGRLRKPAWLLALLVSVSMLGVTSVGAQVERPGVSDTEIRVAGIASISGDPTGGNLGVVFEGANAYFEYINETEGGVFGRELVIEEHDDELGKNQAVVQEIIDGDFFAVLPVAVRVFSGADLLVENNIPTFGWWVNPEWGSEEFDPGPSNFFGDRGGYICISCGDPDPKAYIAAELGLERVGVIAYNVPSSAACVEGVEAAFEKYPVAEIVFTDDSLAFGTVDFSAQVSQMADEKVDYLLSCVDVNANIAILKEMKRQGLEAPTTFSSAYDQRLIRTNAEFMNGNYVLTTFTPFETKPRPPGLKRYLKWMKQTDGTLNETSLAGWVTAHLFVEGLKAAGEDFTRESVIDAINQMTDWDADGLLPTIDWTKAHETETGCYVISKIVKGKFKRVFDKKGEPFRCQIPDYEQALEAALEE